MYIVSPPLCSILAHSQSVPLHSELTSCTVFHRLSFSEPGFTRDSPHGFGKAPNPDSSRPGLSNPSTPVNSIKLRALLQDPPVGSWTLSEVSFEGGLSRGRSASRKVCLEGVLHPGRSASRELCLEGGLLRGRSASREVCLDGGLPRGRSPSREVCLTGGLSRVRSASREVWLEGGRYRGGLLRGRFASREVWLE